MSTGLEHIHPLFVGLLYVPLDVLMEIILTIHILMEGLHVQQILQEHPIMYDVSNHTSSTCMAYLTSTPLHV